MSVWTSGRRDFIFNNQSDSQAACLCQRAQTAPAHPAAWDRRQCWNWPSEEAEPDGGARQLLLIHLGGSDGKMLAEAKRDVASPSDSCCCLFLFASSLLQGGRDKRQHVTHSHTSPLGVGGGGGWRPWLNQSLCGCYSWAPFNRCYPTRRSCWLSSSKERVNQPDAMLPR